MWTVIVFGSLLCFLLGGPLIGTVFLICSVTIGVIVAVVRALSGAGGETMDRLVPWYKTRFVHVVAVGALVAMAFHFLPKNPDLGKTGADVKLTEPPSINQAQLGKAATQKPSPTMTEAQIREANRKAYAHVGDWNYSSHKDEMRGTETKAAQLESRERLEFAFPYSGGSLMTLSVIQRQGKTNISLRVSKGQFMCRGDGESEIKAKFDDGKVQDFRCVGAADASSNVIFIEPESRFLAALKGSKKLLVEVMFFNEGRRQIPFNTAGLAWK